MNCIIYVRNSFLQGSEDLVESLLIDNSSKGPCQTAGALPTSTVTLTSKCDLESSSWAVLDESETTLETSPPPETTFLMTATKNEEMEEDEADAEGGLTLSAAAELPPTSGEGGVDASVEQASESNVQLSSFSSLLERAFNFIQFLSDLLSNLECIAQGQLLRLVPYLACLTPTYLCYILGEGRDDDLYPTLIQGCNRILICLGLLENHGLEAYQLPVEDNSWGRDSDSRGHYDKSETSMRLTSIDVDPLPAPTFNSSP
ncbi:unnamed protein product [Schistocephalus solidus]|uniref:E3 ubiquitin-protein ligase HERC1 n=1 Tax=Schistocephalus solidus TaxID=70667 RepID=A0A183TDG7_SCHSO|nr:unnamed protein product [Schistocephalus solidus]